MATVYVDKSALNTIINDLSSSAKAIAEAVIHNHGMANWIHRDHNPELKIIAVQCEKKGFFEDAGHIYEKQGNVQDAIRTYDTGKLYHRAGILSIASGKTAQADEFAKKLERENPVDALDLYEKTCNTDGIKRTAILAEPKNPFAAAKGYISSGDKPGAIRCADALESAAKQDPTNEKKMMIDVAYIRMHVGDHAGAAAAYAKSESPEMGHFLNGAHNTEYSSGIKIRSDIEY